MNRRHALKTTALASAALAVAPGVFGQTNTPAASNSPFSLPPLPYAADALEPFIDAQTMLIHHGKHHAAYVAGLNKAVASLDGNTLTGVMTVEFLLKALPHLPEAARTAVRNHGGGHYNHTLFWQMMKPGGGGTPSGELANALDATFGNFNAFKEALTKAALGQFGSGWAWLVLDGERLKIETTANQDTPLSAGRIPLLGLDVWEHAYYLKYQNKRADYINAWFNVVNWDLVSERFQKSR